MSCLANVYSSLRAQPRTWLVTGAAGFIGSHLVEALLRLDQNVVALDNYSTGRRQNLEEVRGLVLAAQASRLRILDGDIRNALDCETACRGADVALHQAALGSVPRSLEDPMRTHDSNVNGFLTLMLATHKAGVKRIVYASSSSVYGDHPGLPKVEERLGQPLSPYAASKRICEVYAGALFHSYRISSIGLRYFNVFGARQQPDGAYAAVIPRWFAAMRNGEQAVINGDGSTSRDFCYVANVVQANLLAACAPAHLAQASVYNIAVGQQTSLSELFVMMREIVQACAKEPIPSPRFSATRAGDVAHSLADIAKAQTELGYQPTHTLHDGLREAAGWYLRCVNTAILAPPLGERAASSQK